MINSKTTNIVKFKLLILGIRSSSENSVGNRAFQQRLCDTFNKRHQGKGERRVTRPQLSTCALLLPHPHRAKGGRVTDRPLSCLW